jgi:hypothetical protein
VVRDGGADDIAAMAALQDAAQRDYDLRMPHSPACWRWLVARDGSSQLIVERAGLPVATGRVTPPEDGVVVLGEIAGADASAAFALVNFASRTAGSATLKVMERGGSTAGDAVEQYLAPRARQASCYYVRVPDVAALFDHLRPVLSARLAASDFADQDGEIVLSFFRHHLRMAFMKGKVGEPRPGGRMQAPASVGGAGVAPDLTGSLLLGPDGIAGLVERHSDVYSGPNEALMRVLFPPVRADLLTFYLP